MAITALIVTWNSAPDLQVCLRSLPDDIAVIVVDNASTDDSVYVGRAGGARIVPCEQNVGFARAVNRGLSLVETDLVLLLNPDVRVERGCIEQCAEVLVREPDVAMVGPNTRDARGAPEPPAARRDRTALHVLVESLGLVQISRRFDLQMIHDRQSDRDVPAINGAFMLIRTEVLRSLGGLDDSVFLYLEDQDLCRRVRAAGHRIRFVAGACPVHTQGSSTGRGDEAQQVRAYLHRIDADLEYLRRYGRRGEVAVALGAHVLRALIGLVVSTIRPGRRSRYRAALGYTLRQVGGRAQAPPV